MADTGGMAHFFWVWASTLGASTLRGPTLRKPTLRVPHPFVVQKFNKSKLAEVEIGPKSKLAEVEIGRNRKYKLAEVEIGRSRSPPLSLAPPLCVQKFSIQKLAEIELLEVGIGRSRSWPTSKTAEIELPEVEIGRTRKKKLAEVEIGRSRSRSNGGGPKISCVFFPLSRHSFFILFSLSFGLFRGILVVFEVPGRLKCARLESCEAPGGPGLVGPPGVPHDNQRAQTCTFERPGPSKTAPKFHEKTSQREKKE